MFTWQSVMAVVIRPRLWVTAVGAVFSLARDGWWRSAPFLPLPDPTMLEWRVTTAYGRPDMALVPHDVVSYLRWRKRA